MTELEAIRAGLALVQQELARMKREQAISEEEVYKRLVWYSHLERMAAIAGDYVNGRATRADLEEIVKECRLVHRFVSPAVNTPEQEAERAEAANVLPWRKPA